MSEPFLAEVRITGFNFAPRDWALCDGQLLPISSYQALYSIIGTTYGGDGRTTFAVPDLRGRVGVHPTRGVHLGQMTGEATVALSTREMPAHSHTMMVSGEAATTGSPADNLFAVTRNKNKAYGPLKKEVQLGATTVEPKGNALPHDNLQPYLTMNYIIALVGVFPSRN